MYQELLLVTQVVLLSAALPFAALSAWSYRAAPFGAVLRPIPVITVAFLVEAGSALVPFPDGTAELIQLGAGSVGLVAITWAAIQFVFLLTGRRQI